ncbi:OmpA family protein [Zhongshania sp. BJYM1]|uniref:OmpA family protein n=1 Tax=Zhongshania aquatica TaxID=2965069 RepID=UPI0022B32407|nr:OmpA family protein [Marortus sp. BJYM1]
MSKQWKTALAAGVILASAASAAMAEAEKEKGFYLGGNAFYNQVFDADGTVSTSSAGGVGALGAIPVLGDLLNGLLGGGAAANANFEASYDDDYSYGVTFGYKFESPYRLEFEYRQGENDIDSLSGPGGSLASDGTLEVTSMMGNLWYDFSAGERLRPYIGFGLGQANLDFGDGDDDVLIGQLGAGITYYMTPRLAVDAGYRYSMSEDASFESAATKTEIEYSAQSVMVGLRYNFFDAQYGVKDADGDGVSDEMDQCPGTPSGVQVDSVGCPLDGDNDGVADYLDQCPNTPAGAEVNAVGCPLDGDNDGVVDADDACPDTPAGQAVMSNGCAKDQAVILRGVNFELNSAKLTMNAETILNDVAATLTSSPGFNVELQGHTDSSGSDSYNMNLSQNRAKSVKNYLVGSGVESSRLTATGYGEEQPIASNETSEGRAENRRVELKVLGSEDAMVAAPMSYDEPMVEDEPMLDEPMVEEAPMTVEEPMLEDEPVEEEYQSYEMSEDELDY